MPLTDDPLPELVPPGEPITLENCAREPIHLPGAVQPHGAILVARSTDGVIVQSSANLAAVLGREPRDAIGTSLSELFGNGVADLLDAAEPRPEDAPTGPRSRRLTTASGLLLDAQTFTPAPGLLAVEIEPFQGPEPDALSVVAGVAAWSARLQQSSSIDAIAQSAVSVLRQIAGFDRVWAYRFQPDGHGVIIAEDRAPQLESFLGLHFPESDIPQQARALYVRNPVRVIPDVRAEDAPLVPVVNPETEAWLDLSGGSLRAVSPMHIRYLQNMGVRASMSVSIVVDGQLWGLLSAHHYDGPRLVSTRARAECELLGAITSMQLAAAAELERTEQRLALKSSATRVLDAMAATESVFDGLVKDEDALLGLCRASGAVLSIGSERRLIGVTPDEEGVDRLLLALGECEDDIVAFECAADLDPALEPLSATAAGVLALQLSRRQGNWIVWLRPEHLEEVTWGNRDKELVRRDPGGTLELGERESFERWVDVVRGRSQRWSEAEADAARALRASIGALLITRTEKLARLNDELARSNDELDAFAYAAAHDLREPVRGIEQFGGFFLEDHEALDADGREQIETILRLTKRMGALLDALLRYAKLGEVTGPREPVSLQRAVEEVRELLVGRLGPEYEFDVEPVSVHAEEEGLRQLLLNLVWNAVKYTPGGGRIHIGTCWLSEAPGADEHVRSSVLGDEEPVVVFVRDEGIGVDPEHHEVIFDLFRRLHGRDEYGGGEGAGLTLCRRIVERHGGRIWVDSAPGKGAGFYFTLAPT